MFHLTFVMIMWYAVLYVFISDTTRSCVRMLKEVSLPAKLKEIMLSQLENMGRRRNGKRYTPLVYIICMLLFHYSRSCYAALRVIFMNHGHLCECFNLAPPRACECLTLAPPHACESCNLAMACVFESIPFLSLRNTGSLRTRATDSSQRPCNFLCK